MIFKSNQLFRQHSDHANEWMRFLHKQGREVLLEQLVRIRTTGNCQLKLVDVDKLFQLGDMVQKPSYTGKMGEEVMSRFFNQII